MSASADPKRSELPIALPDGTTALHHAAGAGNRHVAQSLVAHGADLTARDPLYRATPTEWATYFGHAGLAATLRP